MTRKRSCTELIAIILSVLFCGFSSAGPVAAQSLVATVPVGTNPVALTVNASTNKIYVVNQGSNSVTVIDGATNNPARVSVGAGPVAAAVNPATNKIYVVNGDGNSLSVINGSNNSTVTLSVGNYPSAVAVNPITNMAYVVNFYSNDVMAIDGANHITDIPVSRHPTALAINTVTNKIYVVNLGSNVLTVIDGRNNTIIQVSVGAQPQFLAVNEVTNQIYVVNQSNDVSIVDGSTLAVTTVNVGTAPAGLAVNTTAGKIYVANSGSNTATVIDTVTLSTLSIPAGLAPASVAVNPHSNKVYIANSVWQGTLTILDGDSNTTTTISVGVFPTAVAVNTVSNRVYVVNNLDNTVSVIAGSASDTMQFTPVPPCRVVDTRFPPSPFGGPFLSAGTTRSFVVPESSCGIPSEATAYSLNITVVPVGGHPLDYLTIWPTGGPQPVVSTLNSDGRVKANAAIVPAGAGGAVSVYVDNDTDVILDINGYFGPAGEGTLQFFPLPLCRAFDSRNQNGYLGGPYLQGARERDLPLQSSNCQIPPQAVAYSANFTVVPVGGRPLGYLTVWPVGQGQPVVSTLNNPTATIVANAAIVPAGLDGAIAVYPDHETQLIVDINGYFASPSPGGLSLYLTLPCRVIDTRGTGGAFRGLRHPPVNVAASTCGIPNSAQEYVYNATVVPTGSLGYLTLWADGDGQPLVSTLNAIDGVITSNMAIVGNHDNQTDVYADGVTQLILDISSYFAP